MRGEGSATAAVVAAMMTIAVAAAVCVACDEQPKFTPVVDAAGSSSAPTPPPAPVREGCARVGSLELMESDPSCVLKTVRVTEDLMRASMKKVTITPTLTPDSGIPSATPLPMEQVVSGSSGLINITFKNTSSTEVLIAFEAKPRLPGPKTDWSRVIGIPEPKPATESTKPKLFFPMVTTDQWDHDVDSLPTVSESAAAAAAAAGATPILPPPTIFGVYLRPGGKLTQNVTWWALRIPAPAPVVQDDAGHRYYPKTAAFPLLPAEYNIVLDIPLATLTKEERKIALKVKVVKAPKLDAGL
jgi:hypothetical protein